MSSEHKRKRFWPYLFLTALLILMVSYLIWSSNSREPDRALSAATEIEFYSLDGRYFERDWTEAELEKYELFHGWPVLGKTTITDSKTMTELADAFRTGVLDRNAMGAECFWPRHGMRVVHYGVTHDLVICFECNWYEWYKNDESQYDGQKLISDAP